MNNDFEIAKARVFASLINRFLERFLLLFYWDSDMTENMIQDSYRMTRTILEEIAFYDLVEGGNNWGNTSDFIDALLELAEMAELEAPHTSVFDNESLVETIKKIKEKMECRRQ